MSVKIDPTKMRVAIIHDFLVEYGGAEVVLEAMLEIWKHADIYTTEYWPEKFPERYCKYNIKTGFIAKLPFHKRLFNQYKLFHTFYFERLKLDEYDLVVSITSGFAKGVLVHPRIPNISYINTPPRFLWGMETTRHGSLNLFYKLILRPIEHFWRIWDYNAAQRPYKIASNSRTIQARVKKIYGRDSEVIYPPVEVELDKTKPTKIPTEPYFFIVSRLVKYKKIDLIIEAFKKLPYKLLISGTGEEEEALKRIGSGHKNIVFLGRTSNNDRNNYIKNALATIFAGAEDFGIVMVESLLLGTPVIAFNKDGATEIVEDGKTGILFNEQSGSAIIDAIHRFLALSFDKKYLTKSAKKYSKEAFRENLLNFALKSIEEKSKYSAENILNPKKHI